MQIPDLSTPDLVNGCFELFGIFFILPSVLKLHKEKIVRGVSWVHVGFFVIWGLWNLYYYPHLDQWFSFIGGIGVVLATSVWFMQLVYYSYNESNECKA